jgi:hypothetical protein
MAARTWVAILAIKLDSLSIPDIYQPTQFLAATLPILRLPMI